MRRLDLGVASFRNTARLAATLESIEQQTINDWRCFIVHNPSPDDAETREVIRTAVLRNLRFVPVWMDDNVGYAGAVNQLMLLAETEYVAYCDNDIAISTPGWDEKLCTYLDRFHEIGMIFPNGGAYPINRGNYMEIMWGVGFCWAINRLAWSETGPFDATLGHQEEADYAMRVRMAGWKCAAAQDVTVRHNATASNDPAAIERINRGVRKWVDKHNRYFNGKNFNYHSPNVTRFLDWPPNALYLEEYFKLNGLADLNKSPEQVVVNGEKFDLIKVPRAAGFYGSRII